ncbi:MAG: S8 family peptidase [Halospina sp.]
MPPEPALRAEWDRALFGVEQGERTRMAYWVDRERYPDAAPFGTRAIEADRPLISTNAADLLEASIADSDKDEQDQSRAFVAAMLKELEKASLSAAKRGEPLRGPAVRSTEVKGLWSPVTRLFTQAFLADVNDFLFNKKKRARMVDTVKARVATGGGPFVVIGHSQGSMVTYQALMELGDSLEVDLYVTIGSPLGLPQVTDVLHKWHGRSLPIPPSVKRWVNITQDGDIVCLDKTLADEYGKGGSLCIEDERQEGLLWPPSEAHSASRYLSRRITQQVVQATVDRSRFQQVSPVTVVRNLANALDEDALNRVPVLIELIDRDPDGADISQARSLVNVRKNVVRWITSNVLSEHVTADTIHLEDQLDRYVAVNLTRAEVESLAAELGQHYGAASPVVYRMFPNSRKKALIRESIHCIQVRTAQLGYNACGQGITWAVLDTGIDDRHPHFHNNDLASAGSITAVWDCTERGQAVKVPPGQSNDPNGHGTHVAGIIAGGMSDVGGKKRNDLMGMAPHAHLVIYKVLADNGSGYDAWIIKAIEHIWRQNEEARRLVIQGVNLSLGGPFDPASFGCGDSPLCASLLRLVRQGVLVVLAAGNEGTGDIVVDGITSTRSFDLSIGDPANLEDAIAVGSVHPTLPHRYGPSYFSSRGPTADGRLKPDLVGPGEGILSCRSGMDPGRTTEGARKKKEEELYIALSGTSMAAPHVSGLLAGFFSVRQEFIGYPDRVKQILLSHCTDLKRDRYHQGAGLPNLSRMLLET